LGLIGKPKVSKKKYAKLAASDRKDRTTRLQKLGQKINPFELKTNRKKHEVLGKKDKGAVGRPGASKKTGIDNVNFNNNYL
jgi:nucleolar protein 14